jgi:hypothetical protein
VDRSESIWIAWIDLDRVDRSESIWIAWIDPARPRNANSAASSAVAK